MPSLSLTCVAVALVSAAALATQVALTRIFSITLWHHFTYLVIGMALLGYGAAGAVLTRLGTRAGEALEVVLARRARRAALGSSAAYLIAAVIRCDALEFFRDPSVAVSLACLVVLSALPFFGAGMVIATALGGHRGRAGAVYAADLLGAGLGAVLALPALGWLGAPRLVFAAAVAMGAASLLVASRAGGRQLWRSALAVAALLAPLVLAGNDDAWVRPAPAKEIWAAPGGVGNNAFRRWTPMGRIDVTHEFPMFPSMGGEFGRAYLMPTAARMVYQDGAAPTTLYRATPGGKPPPFLRHSSTAVVWVLRGVMLDDRGEPKGKVGARSLVIGVGGGIDVLMALAHGAKHVTGVDINPAMLSLLTDHFRDYTGGLAGRSSVQLVKQEGRSFIRSSTERFDVIQLSGVDTYTALQQGAYSVAEAYLYTEEALSDFFSHLTPDGCVSFSRWVLEPPRETLRLAVTARSALSRRGVREPDKHLVILRGTTWASLVACLKPLSRQQLTAVRAFAAYEGYRLAYDPLQPGTSPWDRALRGASAERDAFARGYPYAIEPATDDSPFFFNYFRWSKLGDLRRMRGERVYTSPVPIGHGIVLGGLIATTVLALLGILLPVRGRAETRVAGRRTFALYFAALGVAYLFVEIVCLQRLTFLLGHPTHALSVVLAALLVSSGCGAAASRWLARPGWLRLALPLAIIAAALASHAGLPRLLQLGFAARVAVSLAVILPLGFMMGMLFPTGLERLRERSESLVPWAFAVNGFFTVVASGLATVIAMETGFTLLLVVAAAVYLGALVLLGRLSRRSSA